MISASLEHCGVDIIMIGQDGSAVLVDFSFAELAATSVIPVIGITSRISSALTRSSYPVPVAK